MNNSTVPQQDLRSLSLFELEEYLLTINEQKFRAKQLYDWMFKKGVLSFEQMTNISQSLKEKIQRNYCLPTPKCKIKQESVDGTIKYLLVFPDNTAVECVAMPTGNKLSVCVSTQSGCAMGCSFCATGKLGLIRSLQAQEIVDQVFYIMNDIHKSVTSVVFMGQGEPFANYSETLKALRILNSKESLNIGARHITVSTCGIIPSITKFAKESEQFTLAISLHSAVQETRNQLMPGVKKYSLTHLHNALQVYTTSTKRRPSYEYAMIDGVNDTDFELQCLCEFCKGTLCHVNLITLNSVENSPFKPSKESRVREFVRTLESVGVQTTVRKSRGADIDAACGQLHKVK